MLMLSKIATPHQKQKQKCRYRASISQQSNSKVSHRKLFSKDRSSSFVKPKIRSSSYLKIFQSSQPLVKRRLTQATDSKQINDNPFKNNRNQHRKIIATQVQSKQHDSVFQIDISKLSTKHIMAQKKKRIQSIFSRILKSNNTQQTGVQINQNQTEEIPFSSKKENITANILYKNKQSQSLKIKQQQLQIENDDVQQMHYYLVKHQQKIKRLVKN